MQKIKIQRGTALIVVSLETETRITNKVFRKGPKMRQANNFTRWKSLRNFFRDSTILEHLFADIEDFRHKKDRDVGLEIDYMQVVGWAGTDDRAKYPNPTLHVFHPTKKSSGLRVNLDRTDIPAPTTELVTIIYKLQVEQSKVTAIIQDVHPGKDVGEFWGDMTEREECVFFHNLHPGIPQHLKPLVEIH